MTRLAALLALLAAPAFAESTPEMEGIYAAAGGGVGLIIAGGNSVAYDGEVRLGYSFNPGMAIYLSGAVDGGTLAGRPFRSMQAAAFLQYHLYAKSGSPVAVYARAGVGVGFGGPMPDLAPDTTGVGLAGAGGLGLEIRLTRDFYLAPEFFYRNATLTATGSGGLAVQVIGVQLLAVYY
jgi:hypothetical protein